MRSEHAFPKESIIIQIRRGIGCMTYYMTYSDEFEERASSRSLFPSSAQPLPNVPAAPRGLRDIRGSLHSIGPNASEAKGHLKDH